VSVGDARHGRRDNGLVAAAYAAAGDVDPRVGEHLLDVLALEGIAAYLRPSSDLHPVTRSTTLPKRPTDRLFVDREHIRTARDHLDRLAREEREAEAGRARAEGDDASRTVPESAADAPTGPDGGTRAWEEPTSDEVDRAFAEIVAGFGHGGPTETRPRPAEDTEPRRPASGAPADSTPARAHRAEPEPDDEPSLLDGLDSFGASLPDDEEGTFVPPEAPPVPRPSLRTALAVAGVVGGLTVFLKPDLLPYVSESLAMFLGFAAVVGGFGTLVWRLRPGGDDDDVDPDHGARV
jgi:hypothetical protein